MTFPAWPKPAGREYPIGGPSPKASTLTQKAISGRVTDQAQWSAPIYEYTVSVSGLNANASPRGGLGAADYQVFIDFWKTVMFGSPCNRFTYSDPNDNSVVNELFGEGDGTTKQFQLTRVLNNFAEPVLVPVCGPSTPTIVEDWGNFQAAPSTDLDWGNFQAAPATKQDWGYFSTLQIFVNGLIQDWTFQNGTAASSGGVVNFTTAPAPGALLTWTGSYLWLCRFTEDLLDLQNFMYQLFGLKKLAFETVHL